MPLFHYVYSDEPLALSAMGLAELGDGNTQTAFGMARHGLPITAALTGLGSKGMSITASLQVNTKAAVTFWGMIGLNNPAFSINGRLVPGPTNITYFQPQEVGNDQIGIPIIQGYAAMTWNYQVMLDSGIGLLMSLYNPGNPQVTVVYPNEYGFWVQKVCMMQPPNLGTRTTIQHGGVQLTFTNIQPD